MSAPYETTLPRLLLENSRSRPDRTALREKHFGIWQPFSYASYYAITAEFAAGLKSLGLGRGDIIVLIGDNRPEWLWAHPGPGGNLSGAVSGFPGR